MYSIFEKANIIEIDKNSPFYPTDWKKLSGAPEILYGVGDLRLLQTQKLCMVGSRKTAMNTMQLTAQMAREISEAFTLVTGNADGGDSAVIEGALKGSGKVISVLAGGFCALPKAQLPLLEQVAKKGLVLSAHPYETTVRNFSYDYRNKLLARLSKGVVVVSAGETSGALITAKYAKQQALPVFALPYAPNTPTGAGCNALIKDGARLIENANDILQFFGVEKRESEPKISLSADEEKVYNAVRELSTPHVTQIAEHTALPAFKVKMLCTSLEMKGLIAPIGGNRYAPV